MKIGDVVYYKDRSREYLPGVVCGVEQEKDRGETYMVQVVEKIRRNDESPYRIVKHYYVPRSRLHIRRARCRYDALLAAPTYEAMPYQIANREAIRFVQEISLQDLAERSGEKTYYSIAGQLRREEPIVTHLSFVIVPKNDVDKDLFGFSHSHWSTFIHAIERYDLLYGSPLGSYVRIMSSQGTAIDIHITTKEKYPVTLLQQTGNKDFLLSLAFRWRKRGYVLRNGKFIFPYFLATQQKSEAEYDRVIELEKEGLVSIESVYKASQDSFCVVPKSEEGIFALLGLKYVEPKNRKALKWVVKQGRDSDRNEMA